MQLITPPGRYLGAYYDGQRIPGSPDPFDLSKGANCQLFAYTLLHHFGKRLLDFRSSDLWGDEVYTEAVDGPLRPLDLMLYHREPKPWGAHVGVYLGDGQIIHLAKHLLTPVIWTHELFLSQPRYQHYIGAKRVL